MALDEATRLIVIRHGETDWNRAGRIQGHTDIPLNALGLEQARRLAEALAEEPLDAIFSSDLRRAQQTALGLAGPRGLSLALDADLRERSFGRFEGLSWDEIAAGDPDAASRWRRREPDFELGGGESLNTFNRRSVAAVLRLARGRPGASLAVVAHGGVLDCLYRAATGLALDASRSWALGNATVNRLLVADGRISLVGWNDERHLVGLKLDETSF